VDIDMELSNNCYEMVALLRELRIATKEADFLEDGVGGCFIPEIECIYVASLGIEDMERIFWHEATHALQYVIAVRQGGRAFTNCLQPIGFKPTQKGLEDWELDKEHYPADCDRTAAIELEARIVEFSEYNKKLLMEAASALVNLRFPEEVVANIAAKSRPEKESLLSLIKKVLFYELF